jgi:hypothetical protein
MLDFDFDVVTGPSKANCPTVPDEPSPEEDESATAPARSGGS